MTDFANQWFTSIVGRKGLKHCIHWTYDSWGSFFDTEVVDGPSSNGTMYSKIKVYYADLAYRQYEETKQVTTYLAFCNFGSVIGLYLGMSIVSIFHLVYYVPPYLYVLTKRRFRRTAVAPLPTSS